MVAVDHSVFYVQDNPSYHFGDPVSRMIFRFLDHCWLGVPMFFVISGYCITAACDSCRGKSNPMGQYFFRRFRRIFPPYWGALIVVIIASIGLVAFGVPQLFFDNIHPFHPLKSFSPWQWLGNLTLTEGWRFNLIGGKRWFLLGPTWTLCYEEQFYAICGLLLILSRRWFFRGAAWLTAAVAVVALIHLVIKPLPIDGFFFDGRWLLFAAGMLVYYRIHLAEPANARWAEALLLVGFVLALGWKIVGKASSMEEYYVGFLFAFLAIVLYRRDLAIANCVVLRPVTMCGIMCYSLYLIHWPVVKILSRWFYGHGIREAWPTLFLTVPLCALAAASAGWVFHLFVERRFLNSAPQVPWKKVPAGRAAASVTLPSSLPAKHETSSSV